MEPCNKQIKKVKSLGLCKDEYHEASILRYDKQHSATLHASHDFIAIHGKLLHEKCGVSNVRTSQTCHIKLPLPVNVTDFYSTVSSFVVSFMRAIVPHIFFIHCQERQGNLLRFVREHFSEYGISIITYEELLKDATVKNFRASFPRPKKRF